MGDFSVFTGAVYLLVFPPCFAQATPPRDRLRGRCAFAILNFCHGGLVAHNIKYDMVSHWKMTGFRSFCSQYYASYPPRQFQYNIQLGCGGNPLKERLRALTTSTKKLVLASPIQAETASGVCPTNLCRYLRRIEPYEVTKETILYINFMVFRFNVHIRLQLCTLTKRRRHILSFKLKLRSSQVKLVLSPKQRAKPAASRTRTCTNAAVCIASGECLSRF
jgi:hypothetical protein